MISRDGTGCPVPNAPILTAALSWRVAA